MTKEELKNLISEYDAFIALFHSAQFVVDGKAAKVRELLEGLTHDEIYIPEKEA